MSVVFAGLILVWPNVTVIVAVFITAYWAILTGAALLAASSHFGESKWPVTIAGGVSVLLGVLLLFAPIHGAIAVAVIVGCYALLFGGVVLGVSLQLRKLAHAATA